ncbi:hypothetical protein O3P69_020464 [Scylla paramamosain]|uniref:Uncharacterized protein n=1 Tax=Scylla paramamosain TaxID=85552 RepID=A0AAW0TLA7_SCYPA
MSDIMNQGTLKRTSHSILDTGGNTADIDEAQARSNLIQQYGSCAACSSDLGPRSCGISSSSFSRLFAVRDLIHKFDSYVTLK